MIYHIPIIEVHGIAWALAIRIKKKIYRQGISEAGVKRVPKSKVPLFGATHFLVTRPICSCNLSIIHLPYPYCNQSYDCTYHYSVNILRNEVHTTVW